MHIYMPFDIPMENVWLNATATRKSISAAVKVAEGRKGVEAACWG